MRIAILSILVFSVLSMGFINEEKKHNYKPPQGYVPDEKTAMRIAEAIWIPIYGEEQISTEKPFKAILNNGVWTVTGSLPRAIPGGVAIAEISKETGCIIRISHGM